MTNTISVGFVSLGCPKNLVDSEHMAGVLMDEGFHLATVPEEADAVIVNTCAFIDSAKEEAIEAILDACELKKDGPCRAVVVTGCLPQRYAGELSESLPEVDAFIGIDSLESIGSAVRSALESEDTVMDVPEECISLFEPHSQRMLFTGGIYAYVKVAEGCNHNCKFCSVPSIRGRYRSRAMSDIVEEVAGLAAGGVCEIDLIAQDITMYGQELDEKKNLAELLKALSPAAAGCWIRILYGHPSHLTDELLETMAALPNVCSYLDIPVQHSHPEMLKAMGRSTSGPCGALVELPAHVRSIIPDVSIRTTCIVGYPGESDEQFEHLFDFVSEARFDHLGVFAFSPQEGTAAALLPNQVPEEVALERREAIMLAQQGIVADCGKAMIGQEDNVLLETEPSADDNAWVGRSQRQAPEIDSEIFVAGVPGDAEVGSFARVIYTGMDGYDSLADYSGPGTI